MGGQVHTDMWELNVLGCESCVDGVGDFVIDGRRICESCAADYLMDHPDTEELIAEAEYRRDCREDR